MRARAPRFEFTRAPRSQTLIGKTFGLYQSSNEKKKGRVPDIQAVRPVSFRNQRKFIGLGGGGEEGVGKIMRVGYPLDLSPGSITLHSASQNSQSINKCFDSFSHLLSL